MNSKYKIILILLSLCLFSCSSLQNNNIAPGYKEAISSIRNIIFGFEGIPITKDLVDNIPYASATLKIGKGPKGLIILESETSGRYTWVSADGVYLVIEDGRIKETSGLLNNLVGTIDPFGKRNFLEFTESEVYKYYQSYDKPELNNLELKVSLKREGKEIITILGVERELNLISETKANDYLGWEVKNLYWVDNNLFVWKSEQYISPKLPKMIIEVTKKPSI